MVTSSRFKEHFEQDYCTIYSNSSNTSSQLYMDPYDIRRQSLSDTISSSSINEQCNLKRQDRVRPRRQRQDSLSSSLSHNSLIGWCLRQKSKISTKLHL